MIDRIRRHQTEREQRILKIWTWCCFFLFLLLTLVKV